ncbi:MAG TPA: cob(I)yrinic acid a,c-diamide adenosyltransferase [Flavobacteriales bacterium]|jgi:cob(I)alamin adenosyltransferase|nr:cob(I)yrinic acid a,c-diamide adenosyltransferase [Flavobacteriales bacterium]
MKVYTKTGDKGTTLLIGGTRVPKHHIKIEAYGTVDELNAHLGLLRDKIADQYKEELIIIQNKLFTLGSFLALDLAKETLPNGKKRLDITPITEEDSHFLEKKIDEMDQLLPPMTHFVLPGGHEQVSVCHICRTVCRRAERKVTYLNEVESVSDELIKYLNRLSDYLFVLARKLSMDLQVEEIPWIPK